MRLPDTTFTSDRYGVARELSLPLDHDRFGNEYVESYRVKNGVLHNPRSDRRTTSGTFHVVEGGLPIPADKKAVPREAYVELFRRAFLPPEALLRLPFTSRQAEPVGCFVSLLLRPLVCPEVPGVTAEKRMEIRFFAPGGLSAIWISWNRFSATRAIRFCRRTTPDWMSSIGPATPARDSSTASDVGHEARARIAARQQGDQPTERAGHVLGNGRRKIQQRSGVQNHLPR